MVREVQRRPLDPLQLINSVLNQPGTGGTTDSVDNQCRFFLLSLRRNKLLLQGFAVIQTERLASGQDFVVFVRRRYLWEFCAVAVVIFETRSNDGFGHGFTAWAAHGFFFAIDDGRPLLACFQRFTAVKAGRTEALRH